MLVQHVRVCVLDGRSNSLTVMCVRLVARVVSIVVTYSVVNVINGGALFVFGKHECVDVLELQHYGA